MVNERRSPSPSVRFPVDVMLTAARLYYIEDLTQAQVARELGMSRASVSRVLAEARRQGIVTIDIRPPSSPSTNDVADHLARALGLQAVYLSEVASSPSSLAYAETGGALAAALSRGLADTGLRAGDVLLMSSGRTMHAMTAGDILQLPGIVVAPMIGGKDKPEPWYQPNEITRRFAERVGGRPSFLYAPALPGPDLYPALVNEPSIRRVLDLWRTASAAIIGVGAPPLTRHSLPRFVPADALALREAVGDVCSRFYDRDGHEVPFPGSERLMSTSLETLQEIPTVIAVATGVEKIDAIRVGAREGYFSRLVTDSQTAFALLAAVGEDLPDERPAPAAAAPAGT